MAAYTCITCRVAFVNPNSQRAHYKTDWHRYNLKRKVGDMHPVTAENFQERVLAQRAVVEEQSKETATYCTVCSKRFSTFNAYENHLKSKKHLDLEKKAAQAVTKKVEMMNEKNLEKGLEAENVDKDAMNVVIQQAIKAQPSMSPKKKVSTAQPSDMASVSDKQGPQVRTRPGKPPRLQWYEQQAKKLASIEDENDSVEEEEWEDMESEDDGDSEEDEEMEDDVADEGSSAAAADGTALTGAFAVTECLFCSHHSRSLLKNVAHMTKVHSFFIPDIEFLQDLQGLISYLGEKVCVGKICLWCNERGKSFYTTESVQAHMVDKSHCRLFTDGDAALEFADFYDFRSSYPDHKEVDDVETDDSDVPDDKNLEFDEETMELVLPSGARIGHRSLMRYYKQKFGLTRAVVVSKNQKAVGRVLQQYKALGWTGGTGGTLQHGRDMQYIQKMKSKWMLKTGMANNSTKQMHFRAQVRF
ncbi:PREDICTED: zinc finger protein 622 isoform X2 [Nanorana parkeri]|uniref:zinc finger protein 622 isoform X2 n=1 Tax=Nanorana parkeri TaxID=125878 RepID=UPI000854026D|nr:PREDICTED: zinc finger protein 622 isoform X2 [Nanorana parkeri]